MQITAKAQDGRALIEIKGNIAGWKDTERNFTATVNSLIDSGIKDAHLYINSPGGDCFEANEIVNVIHKFPGKITGEGGAMVASAATYIAINCASFTMPANGMFMVHQPSGMAMGRKAEIESYLSLLEKISKTYFDAYLAKTTMKEDEFRQKWEAGDFWMTAAEAKQYGFADEIGSRTAVTKATAKMIMEAGYTGKIELTEETPPSNNPLKNDFKMDLNAMLTQFGIAANTTELQFITMVGDWKRKAERTDMLERKEEERQDAEIEALLNEAILKKRITADVKEDWRESLKADFERGRKMISGLPGVEKPKVVTPNKPSVTGTDGTTWEKLMEENPEALAKMETEDPEAYKALFEDFKKRNKV